MNRIEKLTEFLQATPDDSFLKQAYYKGGDTALKEFISQNLKYPESYKKNN